MERHNILTTHKGLAWFLVVLGALLAILGGVLLIIRLLGGEVLEFSLFSAVAYLVQGVLLVLLGGLTLRSGKYFVEWDQKEIRIYLPANKRVEVFEIDKITRVDIHLFQIQLTLGENTGTIDLENAQFKEIRKIKEKFEEIKRAVEA